MTRFDNLRALEAAREVLSKHGIEIMNGSMAWRGNVYTGYAIPAAMLDFADAENARLLERMAELEGALRPFAESRGRMRRSA